MRGPLPQALGSPAATRHRPALPFRPCRHPTHRHPRARPGDPAGRATRWVAGSGPAMTNGEMGAGMMVEGAGIEHDAGGSGSDHDGGGSDQMFHGLPPANPAVSQGISPTCPHIPGQWYSPPAVARPWVTDEVAATETGVGWSHSTGFSLGEPVGETVPRATHCATNPVAESPSGCPGEPAGVSPGPERRVSAGCLGTPPIFSRRRPALSARGPLRRGRVQPEAARRSGVSARPYATCPAAQPLAQAHWKL